MERGIERAAGLDVHRDTVAAWIRIPGAKARREQHIQTFGTATADLPALRDQLEAHGVKLASVATDILGVSRRARLEALGQGTTDPAVLAELARGKRRASSWPTWIAWRKRLRA